MSEKDELTWQEFAAWSVSLAVVGLLWGLALGTEPQHWVLGAAIGVSFPGAVIVWNIVNRYL